MLKSLFIALLAASTVAYAQFSLQITQPTDQEFIILGTTISVEIQAPNTPAGTPSANVQVSLCTVITGLPPCNNTMGTILLNAPYNSPDETYEVTIPAEQQPGLTQLIVGHIQDVNGIPTLTDKTSIDIFLGSNP